MRSDLTPPVIYRQTQRGQKDHPKTLRYVPFFLEEIQSLPPASCCSPSPPGCLHTPHTPVPGTFKLWLALAGVVYPAASLLVLSLSWVTVTAHASVANKRGWQVLMGSAWAMSALLYTSRLSSDLLPSARCVPCQGLSKKLHAARAFGPEPCQISSFHVLPWPDTSIGQPSPPAPPGPQHHLSPLEYLPTSAYCLAAISLCGRLSPHRLRSRTPPFPVPFLSHTP